MSAKTTAFAAAAALLALGIAIYEARQARSAAAMLAQTTRERDALAVRVVTLEKRATIGAKANAPAAANPSETPAKPPSAPPQSAIPSLPADMKARLELKKRWTYLAHESDFLGRLRLPPEKIAGLADLLHARNLARNDALDAARQAGIEPNSSEGRRAARNAENSVDAEIATLLGPEDYARFHQARDDYEINNTQMVQGDILGCFVDRGVPLSEDQVKQLAVIMNQTNRSFMDTPERNTRDPVTGFLAAQTVVATESAKVLTPAQLEALNTYFRNDAAFGGWINTQLKKSPVKSPNP